MQVNFAITMLLTSLFSLPSFAWENYPSVGKLSNTSSDQVEFLNLSCDAPNKENNEIQCRKIFTTIEANVLEIRSLSELKKMAEQDGFDADKMKQECNELKPMIDLLQGKSVDDKKLSEEKLTEIKKFWAARGFDKNMTDPLVSMCQDLTMSGVVRWLDTWQRAAQRVCRVEVRDLKGSQTYKLDENTGNFVDSGVFDGRCDRYAYAETITPDERFPWLIQKYEDSKTFIKKLKTDKNRDPDCDPGRYYEKTYENIAVYSPLNCVSFVSY